jgi:cell division septal protein FtsQ
MRVGVPSANRKRRGTKAAILRFCLALVVLVALGGAAYAGVRASQDPRFALGDVAVHGCSRSSPDDVLAAAALPRGSNIWLLDTGGAATRIEALPWTNTAKVTRAWPNSVSVTVTERRPAARLALPASSTGEEPGPARALVDAQVHVLAVGPDDPRDLVLPVLTVTGLTVSSVAPGADLSNTDAAAAFAAYRTLQSAGLHVHSVDIGIATGIGVVTADNLRVLFGPPEGLAQKVALYRNIVVKIAAPKNVAYIDLRSARAPTVLFR